MDSPIEEKTVSNFDDDQDDDEANVEEIKDDDAQVFDKELTREFENRNTPVYEPGPPTLFDDEGKDSSVGGSDTSDVEGKSSQSIVPPLSDLRRGYGRGRYIKKVVDEFGQSIVPPLSGEGCGRGRYGKKALDELNQELPPPGIQNVVQKGFYWDPARKAFLSQSCFRKREDPETQNQRRAPRVLSPVINFKAEFNQISFIVDKDDSKEIGYQHACKRLQQILPDLQIDSSKSPYDIWSFGLYTYPITFQKSVSCNLLDLIPQEINNEKNRPFWFMFKHPPKFEDLKFLYKTPKQPDVTSKQPDGPRGTRIRMNRGIYADLSYGALTSMTRFCVHKDYIFRTNSRWSLYFHEEFFEIQIIKAQNSSYGVRMNPTEIRYKIPLDIIDRAAIIHLWNNGFSLYLNMKGNIHELHREYKPRVDTDTNFKPFIRQGMKNNKPMPLFSTICIRIRLRDDEQIREFLERDRKISKDTASGEKDRLIKDIREDSLNQIHEIFKSFLDFFSNNRIHICFGLIYQKIASLEQINSHNWHSFPTFIQEYSWAMLCNIGFRLQMQLYLSKTFIQQLYDYSKIKYDEEEEPSNIDDRFYRLCLHLHRRSSEYFFLDLDIEIKIGIQEYDTKYRRSKQRKPEMPAFNQLASSTAYIPSVVITPTTVKIRPLKLCKLNRVLREEKFGGVLNFALIELRDEAQRSLFQTAFRSLKKQILYFLTVGVDLTPYRVYKYLHHSQSQVKCKQFWFYYHDKEHKCLSHEDAYIWMGNFDKERVVAKYAARIALCFTSTDATIQITADKVTYDRDVKDATKKYAFSDGVGTISPSLRDEIKDFLKCQSEFSVLQIRYGGCKGTLSVDPRLENQQYQLKIRDSMNKFTTDHDILELCKLSAPCALYLNREDIVLLESRDIPHINFLHLQNEDHLRLVYALLKPSIAYESLQDKILPVFELQNIARNINIVEEQFFIKLIITCAFNIVRELISRTRIRVSDKKARNMFGIVDEYGVLEYGQVFVQYTIMRENKLELSKEEEEEEEERKDNSIRCEILTGKVVLTKNPCHHPGDLRVFDAVYRRELRHLKDCVVFPQKGPRPHSNEISGSDLDGDEYVVIWHEDLIPSTPNATPYDYDSQEDPPKMNRPITREDINQIVMEVSEQDCLGTLSNIHLAYADRDGIESKTCIELAGAISQEVDAAKTGKHPLTDEQIIALRNGLDNKWPDFMTARGKKHIYPSKRILGKLYRSARRAVIGWSRAISNHGNPRHIHLALALAAGTDIKNQENDELVSKTNTLSYYEYPLDPYIYHDNYRKYLPEIKTLYKSYQSELLEIISLYRFQDEIDLFCRCESMDASAGGSKKGSLEDSAAIEVQNLIKKITQDFFSEFVQLNKTYKCCKYIETCRYGSTYWKRIDCEACAEDKLAKAACAYIHCYTECNRLPLKSYRRILSFPWLFSGNLLKLRNRNQKIANVTDQRNTIVGLAFKLYLNDFTPKFKVFIPNYSIDIPMVEFYYKKIEGKRTSLSPTNRTPDETISFIPLLRACFVEILNDWLIKQKVFGYTCTETDPKPLVPESIWHELLVNFLSYEYQPNVRLISASNNQSHITERYGRTIEEYRLKWTNIEYEDLQNMFNEIHAIALRHARNTNLTIWAYLSEYIILALQCIGIEKRLVDHEWICPPSSF